MALLGTNAGNGKARRGLSNQVMKTPINKSWQMRYWQRFDAIACGALACAGGLALIGSIIAGEVIGALLGAGMVVAAWLVFSAGSSIKRVERALVAAVKTLRRIEVQQDRSDAPTEVEAPPSARQEAWTIDLAAFGSGDSGRLAAATLDRRRFPRLATVIDEEPPFDGSLESVHSRDLGSSHADLRARNLVAEWNEALRTRDLEVCRRLYATMVDTAPASTVAPLSTLLKTLSKEVERSLREDFARHVRDGRYAKAIETGQRIKRLFPDQQIARQYEELRPLLERRVV